VLEKKGTDKVNHVGKHSAGEGCMCMPVCRMKKIKRLKKKKKKALPIIMGKPPICIVIRSNSLIRGRGGTVD